MRSGKLKVREPSAIGAFLEFCDGRDLDAHVARRLDGGQGDGHLLRSHGARGGVGKLRYDCGLHRGYAPMAESTANLVERSVWLRTKRPVSP